MITRYRAAVFGLTVLLLIGLWAFMRYTPFGRILRAGSRDPEMVGLLGINLPILLTAGVRPRLRYRRRSPACSPPRSGR